MYKNTKADEKRDGVIVDRIEHTDGTWSRLSRFWGRGRGTARAWQWVVGRGYAGDDCAVLGGNLVGTDEARARACMQTNAERYGVQAGLCVHEVSDMRHGSMSWQKCGSEPAERCAA